MKDTVRSARKGLPRWKESERPSRHPGCPAAQRAPEPTPGVPSERPSRHPGCPAAQRAPEPTPGVPSERPSRHPGCPAAQRGVEGFGAGFQNERHRPKRSEGPPAVEREPAKPSPPVRRVNSSSGGLRPRCRSSRKRDEVFASIVSKCNEHPEAICGDVLPGERSESASATLVRTRDGPRSDLRGRSTRGAFRERFRDPGADAGRAAEGSAGTFYPGSVPRALPRPWFGRGEWPPSDLRGRSIRRAFRERFRDPGSDAGRAAEPSA